MGHEMSDGVGHEVSEGNLTVSGWGKQGVASRYLGLQGTGDESRAMDESQKPLPCGEDMESDFKRFGIESVNVAVESLTGRIAKGEEGDEEHGFL